MANNTNYLQVQTFNLAGAGVSVGDGTMLLQSFNKIDGTPILMTDFGTKGYGTCEPNTRGNEEPISFTGVTQNMNGTATLTGVFSSPYGEPGGTPVANFLKSHAGGTRFIITDTPEFLGTFANTNDNATIHQTWTFNANSENANPKIDSNSYVFQPLDYITTGGVASLIVNGTFDYFVDSGSVNTIVITPSPAVASYAAGQHFFIKVANTNTGTTTINVNGLGAETLKKQATVNISAGDVLAGEIILVSYDGTNFQLIGGAGGGSGGSGIVTRSNIGAFVLAPGVTDLIDTAGTSGATAGNVMASSGSVTDLFINSTSNTLDGATVYTLLKNGSPTSVTVTVGASTNGIFHDTAHAFNVVGGDIVTLQCDTTASTINTGNVSFSYQVGNGGASIPIVPSIQSFIFDDFIGGGVNSIPVAGSDYSSFGELGWSNIDPTINIAKSISSNDANHPGVLQLHQTSGGSLGIALGVQTNLGINDPISIAPVNSPNTTLEYMVKLGTAGANLFFGIGTDASSDIANNTKRLGLTSNSSTWQGFFADGATIITTSTVATSTSWVKLTMVTDATGANCEFFVNGSSLGSLAISDFSAACSPVMATAPTATTDVDYFYFNRVLTR